MRRFQRLGWAALASLAIHVTLLALLWDAAPPVVPALPPTTSQAPLVVEFITRSTVEPSTPPPPPREERPAKPPPLREPRPRHIPAKERAPSTGHAPDTGDTESPSTDPTSPGTTPHASQAPEAAPDTPKQARPTERGFFPLPPSLLPGGPPVTGPKLQSGHTLRPGDPSLSPEALAAREEARVSGRVQGFIDDKQAELRVANAQIDPYFSRLREALEKSLEDAPVFDGISLLGQATHSWASQAGRFGATGNPGTGPVPAAPTVSEKLKELQERDGDESMEDLRARIQAGEELQKLAGGGGSKLVVTLELHQGPDGTLRDVKLVSTSGNKAYDAYVLSGVPPALVKLAPPPDKARGVRPEGIHTLWSVEGRVVYLRKLKDLKGQDTLYMAAAAAAGVLAGRFEETTGEIEVIDFRNPRFVCQARLLRVY